MDNLLRNRARRIAYADDCALGETTHGTTALVATCYPPTLLSGQKFDYSELSHQAACASIATSATYLGLLALAAKAFNHICQAR